MTPDSLCSLPVTPISRAPSTMARKYGLVKYGTAINSAGTIAQVTDGLIALLSTNENITGVSKPNRDVSRKLMNT